MADGSAPAAGEAGRFGTVLTKLRRSAGLTQVELAERSGLSARGIGNLERGERRPRRFTVQLLADGLGLSGSQLSTLLAAAERTHAGTARGRAPHDGASGDGPAELVGRDAELRLLDEHLTAVDRPLLLLTGEAGIGKTRLLAEAGRLAAGRSVPVLSAGCDRLGGQPYAPVVDALAAHVRGTPPQVLRRQLDGCAWLDRLLPEVAAFGPGRGDVDPAHARRLMFGAAGRFLAGIAARRGVLLVLDDLQWAGPDGLALLASLTRSVRPDQVRIVAAYRDNEIEPAGDLAHTVDDLVRQGLVTHRRVGLLAESDAAALLRETVGPQGLRAGPAERVVRLAGGLPLFVVQLGKAAVAAGGALDELPWGLTHAVGRQVGALPGPTVELLRLVAVAERRIGIGRLAAAAGADVETATELLRPAHVARLLDETPDGVRMTHDLVAEVIRAELTPSRRRLVHRRLAESLHAGEPAGGAEPVATAAAYHYTRADDVEHAAVMLRQAADEATHQAAHDTAARYLNDLVALLDRAGDEAAVGPAAEALSAALGAAGRYDAALAAAERALLVHEKTGDATRRRLVVAQIGHLHYQRGTPQAGVARIGTVLTADRRAESSPAQLHLALAANLYLLGRHPECVRESTLAIRLAAAARDDRGVAAGHLRRGLAARLLSDSTAALEDLRTAASLAELAGDRETVARALTGVACIRHYAGELGAADDHFKRTLALAEQVGDTEVLIRAVTNQGASAFWLGDWSSALAHYDRAADLSTRGGSSAGHVYALVGRGGLLIEAGLHRRGGRDAAAARAAAAAGGHLDLTRAAEMQLAELDLRLGRPERAVARLAPLLDRSGLREWQVTDFMPVLAAGYVGTGRIRTALRIADGAVTRAREIGHTLALVDALRVRAQAQARSTAPAAATAGLDEALALARSMGSPYAEARVRTSWADVAAQRGADEEASRETALATALMDTLRTGMTAALRPADDDPVPA